MSARNGKNLQEENFRSWFAKQVVGKKKPARMASLFSSSYSAKLLVMGCLKERVYSRKPRDVDMLKIAIAEEIHAITINMYHKATSDFPKRCANYAWM